MKCINCQNEFVAKRSDAKFCSLNCRVAYSRNTPPEPTPTVSPEVTPPEIFSPKTKPKKKGYTIADFQRLTAGLEEPKSNGFWRIVEEDGIEKAVWIRTGAADFTYTPKVGDLKDKYNTDTAEERANLANIIDKRLNPNEKKT
jgi:hypothetical protein